MLGLIAAPDACYKALRDMRTVALRMQQQDASARTLARWLQQQSQVRVSAAATGSCNRQLQQQLQQHSCACRRAGRVRTHARALAATADRGACVCCNRQPQQQLQQHSCACSSRTCPHARSRAGCCN
jgi:hypothetical protein